MKSSTKIEKLAEKLLPLTEFRRRAGAALDRLDHQGELILTKDGRPIARIISLGKSREDSRGDYREKARRLAGGLHLGKLSPQKVKKIIYEQYPKVLP